MNKTEFKNKLQQCGLGSIYNSLEPHIKSSVRFYTRPAREEDIPFGSTKIGGVPHLPSGWEWPTETYTRQIRSFFTLFGAKPKEITVTEPYTFIAQVNLAEIKQLDKEQLLPARGFLYFFCLRKTTDCWLVKYYDQDLQNVAAIQFPDVLSQGERYGACVVDMKEYVNLPYNRESFQGIVTDEENDQILQILDPERTTHKLLGYADEIQSEMECECEMQESDVNYGKLVGKEKEAFHKHAEAEWQLLLQIDSDENANMMFGDAGRLYYWIRKTDLQQLRFDKVQMIMQCY